jgi:hypothetical protein
MAEWFARRGDGAKIADETLLIFILSSVKGGIPESQLRLRTW